MQELLLKLIEGSHMEAIVEINTTIHIRLYTRSLNFPSNSFSKGLSSYHKYCVYFMNTVVLILQVPLVQARYSSPE